MTKTQDDLKPEMPEKIWAGYRKSSFEDVDIIVYYEEKPSWDENVFEYVRADRALKGSSDARELVEALEEIEQVRYGLEMNADTEEQASYFFGLVMSYRKIAREALAKYRAKEENGK